MDPHSQFILAEQMSSLTVKVVREEEALDINFATETSTAIGRNIVGRPRESGNQS
jgi:hypothetical protein